jgi:thioredoxin-related protein
MAIGVLLAVALTVQAQDWQTDFEQAKLRASEAGKPIILVFQGSDWCAPCIKLDREVWSTPTFKEYAAEHFILLQADFPRRRANALPDELAQQNAQLAEIYNQRGIFPLVVVLDAEGHVLGETGYKKLDPAAYIEHLETFNHPNR